MARKTVPEQQLDHHLRLITPQQAAERLGGDQVWSDPKREVLRMARRGLLRAVPVGKFMMIDPTSVDAYIKGRL